MKMTRYQKRFVGILVLACLNAVSMGYAEDTGKADHDANTSKTESRSKGTEKLSVSKKFEENIKFIESKTVEGGTVQIQLKKETDTETKTESISLDKDKLKEVKQHLGKLKIYGEKLLKCESGFTDSSFSAEFLKTLNKLIDSVDIKEAKDGKYEISAKELNTLVFTLTTGLKNKAEKFKRAEKSFVESDKEVKEALEAMAKLLQNVNDLATALKDQAKVDDSELVKIVNNLKAEEAKVCQLDPQPAPPTSEQTQTKPDDQSQTTQNDQTQTTPNDQPQPTPINPSQPTPTGTNTPTGSNTPVNDPSVLNNQLAEALAALRTNQDELDRLRAREEELLQQRLNDQNIGNEQALRALQGALNQAQRPNVSRGNSDRSEQGPQISPSLSTPPSQQQPFPQMPMQPMQPPPQLPLGALMNNGPAQQPIIPYTPSRFNDDIPARPAVQQQDPTTSALLQTMQQQNQMFQQMMMGRYPYMGAGTPNVNGTVGQQLQNFGGGYSPFRLGAARRGGGPRLMPQRFSGGVARGGVQGQMGANPGARGPIPSRLNR